MNRPEYSERKNTTDSRPRPHRAALASSPPQTQHNPLSPVPYPPPHINVRAPATNTLEPEPVHGRELGVHRARNVYRIPYMDGYPNSFTNAPLSHPSEPRFRRRPRREDPHSIYYVQPQPYGNQTSFRPGVPPPPGMVPHQMSHQMASQPMPPNGTLPYGTPQYGTPPYAPYGMPLYGMPPHQTPLPQMQASPVAPLPIPPPQMHPPLSYLERNSTHRPRLERHDSLRRTIHEHDPMLQSDQKIDANVLRVDIAQTTDITLHSKLETVEDISVELEDFSRLCRLGNFAAAKYHFMKNLDDHKDNLYVHVQYVQMLLQSGDFKTLNSMKPISESMFAHHKALYRNYKYIMHAAMLHNNKPFPNESYEHDWKGFYKRYMSSNDKCSSTEVQSLTTVLHNSAYTSRFRGRSDIPHVRGIPLIRGINNVTPYTELLGKGQIWDYRDVLTGLIHSDPKMDVLPSLFEAFDTVGLLDIIIKHLEADFVDESTSLAILDITETILLAASRPKDQFQRLLERATTLVSSLVQDNPDLVASRQYLRWMLVKLSIEYHEPSGMDPYSSSPGIFLTHYSIFCLPLYIPCQSEMPTPFNAKLRPDRISFIKIAIDGARSIQDYDTEALCLQAFIFETENPLATFDELARLQKYTQGDMQGCLQTYLSKYVFCRDHSSRSALKKDILSLRYSDSFPSVLLWARAMILRALAESVGEASSYLDLAARHVFSKDVPERYRSFLTAAQELRFSKIDVVTRYPDPALANLSYDPGLRRPKPLSELESASTSEQADDSEFSIKDTHIRKKMPRHRHSIKLSRSAPAAFSPRRSQKKTSKNKLPGDDDIAIMSASDEDKTRPEQNYIPFREHPSVRRSRTVRLKVITHNTKADKRKTAAQMSGHAEGETARKSAESEDDTISDVFVSTGPQSVYHPGEILGSIASEDHTGTKSVSTEGSISEREGEYANRDKPEPQPNDVSTALVLYRGDSIDDIKELQGNANQNQLRRRTTAPTVVNESEEEWYDTSSLES